MKEITTSIIQKVKDELNISEDLSSKDLYDLLFDYRNNNHPDKFLDENLKETAEEKFKNLSILLKELQSFIERQHFEKKPSELIVYEKDFELIKLKQQLVDLEQKNKLLDLNIKDKENQIIKLSQELDKVTDTELEEKTADLITLYKPNNKSLFSLGLTVIITLLAGALTKIEEVATLINKYSPLEPKHFKLIVFSVLLFFILRYCKKSIEGSRVEYTAKRIKTPLTINKFVNYLDQKNIGDSFTEMNVYEFLSKEFVPKGYFTKLFFSKIFHLYSETTIDIMKDIFIYNLINKKLVTISNATRLDRKFKIVKSFYEYDPPYYRKSRYSDR